VLPEPIRSNEVRNFIALGNAIQINVLAVFEIKQWVDAIISAMGNTWVAYPA
jgi:hypothetical protein